MPPLVLILCSELLGLRFHQVCLNCYGHGRFSTCFHDFYRVIALIRLCDCSVVSFGLMSLEGYFKVVCSKESQSYGVLHNTMIQGLCFFCEYRLVWFVGRGYWFMCYAGKV